MRRLAALVLPVLMLIGCATRLAVDHDPTGDGIVLRQPTPHAITVRTTKLDKNRAPCGEEYETRFVVVPLGPAYTVNVDEAGSWFAKSALTVEFFASGAPKRIALNGDPQVDETIAATADLIEETAALVTRSEAPSARASGVDRESCGELRDEHVLCVQTYEDWMREPEKCRAAAGGA